MSPEPSFALLQQSQAHQSNIYHPNDTLYYPNTEVYALGRMRKNEIKNEKMKKSTKWISDEKKRVEGNIMRDLGHNGESQAA